MSSSHSSIRTASALLILAALLSPADASAQSLVENGGFDTDLSFWVPVSGDAFWDALDRAGANDSGSALLHQGQANSETAILQCVTVTEGLPYRLLSFIMSLPTQETAGQAGVQLWWYSDSNCTTETGRVEANIPPGFPGVWFQTMLVETAPPGAGSAAAVLSIVKNTGTETWEGVFDDAYMNVARPFSGFHHDPLGEAVIKDNPNGNLVISDIGDSGLDGVEIALGEPDGFQIQFGQQLPAGNLPVGASVEIVGPAITSSPLATLESVVGVDGLWLSTPRFETNAALIRTLDPRYDLELYLDGIKQLTVPVTSEGWKAAETPEVVELLAADRLRFHSRYASPTQIEPVGFNPVIADEVVMTATASSGSQRVSQAILYFRNLPDVEIVREAIRFDRAWLSGTGDVVLSPFSTQVELQNLGSPTPGSLVVDQGRSDLPPGQSMRLALGDPPLAEDLAGATQRLTPLDADGNVLAGIEAVDIGAYFDLSADFSGVGASAARILVSRNGAPVTEVANFSGTVMIRPGLGSELSTRPLADGSLGLTTGWREPIAMTITGVGTVTGDQILWLPDGVGNLPLGGVEVSALAFTSSNTPPLTVSEAVVGEVFADDFESGTTDSWSGVVE